MTPGSNALQYFCRPRYHEPSGFMKSSMSLDARDAVCVIFQVGQPSRRQGPFDFREQTTTRCLWFKKFVLQSIRDLGQVEIRIEHEVLSCFVPCRVCGVLPLSPRKEKRPLHRGGWPTPTIRRLWTGLHAHTEHRRAGQPIIDLWPSLLSVCVLRSVEELVHDWTTSWQDSVLELYRQLPRGRCRLDIHATVLQREWLLHFGSW